MKKVLAILFMFVISFSIIGCGEGNKSSSSSSVSSSAETQKQVQPNNKSEPNWNKSEIDAKKNGNLPIAVGLVTKNGDLASLAIDADPAEVMKRPWDYYGKVVRFTGEAQVLQDYPPDSDISKSFNGESCELVMTSGETIVDGMYKGTTKGISNNQTVTTYGYPVGTMDVPNKIGGSFNHLIVVGTIAK